jgi:predicted ATPase/signal transduction histidine kinase/CheY-like chemotaxis protein/tRNA A-37 threonylcarbamoyl transferase component Bud32
MDYVLGTLLYSGARTRVVEGTHPTNGERVAIKFTHERDRLTRAEGKLRHEHALLSELAAPGIIRAIALETTPDGLALVMERWGDASLDRALARMTVPLGAALRIGAAIARVLARVHRHGVIHCDVKPQNVLVDAALTEVRLIDFGAATRRPSHADEGAVAAAMAGTLAYMAPEQTGRMRRPVDARADLYALGATLYQLLTGALPFETLDVVELVHAHIARTPVPPHERAPERRIPEVVSAIVMKLLEKSPERRYQTGDGLAADLKRAAEAWDETGEVAPFALASRDWDDRVRAPSRLFGRERELAHLTELLDRAAQGEVAVALVAGPSGVGKSALVHALRDRVLARRGLLAPGKFDLLRRGAVYDALAQALRQVVRRRLADSAERVSRWKIAWQKAAGPNARILIDLVPELRHFLDDVPPLLDLAPTEAKNRFQLTVQRFVRATATAEHPLALFVDDLQWADAPSLDLLSAIASDPEAAHLLVVGSYRDTDVDGRHPLHAISAAAKGSGRAVVDLALAPLGDEALEAMVADMLDQPPSAVRELADQIKTKTDGSPFFVEQFLRALHERRLLCRDLEGGAWRWDAEAIDRAEVTDNVVSLLAGKIGALSEGARRALSLGACAGPRFDGALVAAASGLDAAAIRAAVDELLHEGLVVAADDDDDDAYAFVHDGVQQAAYEALPDDERVRAHAALARVLDTAGRWETRDDALFATVDHYRRSLLLLDGPGEEGARERRRVASLFLRGGERAKAASAYEHAATSLRAGRDLLGDDGWNEDFKLTFTLNLALAEAEWLADRPEAAEALFAACDARARDLPGRARVATLRLPLLFLAGRFDEGLANALARLAPMGLPFPDDEAACGAALGALIGRIAPKIMAIGAADFRALPRCVDPLQSSAVELLGVARLHAGGAGKATLQACIIFTLVEHAFSHGISAETGSAVSMAAIAFVGALQQIELGAKCIELVFALRDLPDLPQAAALYQASLPAFHIRPSAELLDLWDALPEICEREGNTLFLEYVRAIMPPLRLFRGVRLDACGARMAFRNSMCREIGVYFDLTVEALSAASLEDARATLDRLQAHAVTSGTARVGVLAMRAYIALHLGEDAEALRVATEAESLWVLGYCAAPDLCTIETLSVLGPLALPEQGEEAAALRARIAFHRARLDKYALLNPTSFAHQQRLAEAGSARAEGRHEAADRLYDEAIDGAQKSGFTNNEALALRLAGEHHLARGRTRAARAYLRDAHDAYLRWGSHAAAAAIRARHPALFPTRAGDGATQGYAGTTSTSTTTIHEGALDARLDAASLMRAAQALSEDMVLGSVLGRMLRVLAENAGAERAVLALARGDALRVRAVLSVDPERLEAELDEPLDGSTRVPTTLLQYVARSREPVVLGKAGGDARFDEDPYLRERRPASVLAVPLVHRGRLSGVVYLEHPRAAQAFPEVRVETAALLASQAATTVENATLYAELAASNERLERQVRERTAELHTAKDAADAANRAKSDFLTSMSHELRTPLNSILGYAQVLSRSASLATSLPEGERDGLRIIRRSGEHLLTLINDVLDLAKIEAGKLELSPRDVRLELLVRTVAGMSQVRADEKRLAFSYEMTGDPVESVRVDEKRLTQVLLNLLGNAIKFTERGRVRLEMNVRARPGGAPKEKLVVFRIEDTGPGIAEEHRARIFEPFEQAGDARSRGEGTGLGLAITRRIVQHMGGQLEVESEVGRGSAFIVTLPLVEAGAGDTAKVASWEQIIGYLGERRAILLVDDHAENRAVMRTLLAPLGFDLVEAARGEEAVALAVARRPAVILLDLAMPDLDGYEVARRLRLARELSGVVIIASSASAGEQVRARCASAGCDEFLAKPIRAEELLEMLNQRLQLTWVTRGSPAAAPPAMPPESLPPPPTATIAELAELADGGRVRALLDALATKEAEAPEFAAWFDHVRGLTRRLEIKALRDFLRAAPRGG